MSATDGRSANFAVGETVRIDEREAIGHCRTPHYLRGRTGIVVGVHGAFRDPERLAYHRPGLPPQVLYKVRFRQHDLWTGYSGPATDHLEADIYENWLKPAKSRKREAGKSIRRGRKAETAT